eukprot:2218151-Rhodomonas_salina.1
MGSLRVDRASQQQMFVVDARSNVLDVRRRLALCKGALSVKEHVCVKGYMKGEADVVDEHVDMKGYMKGEAHVVD